MGFLKRVFQPRYPEPLLFVVYVLTVLLTIHYGAIRFYE